MEPLKKVRTQQLLIIGERQPSAGGGVKGCNHNPRLLGKAALEASQRLLELLPIF